MSADWITAVLTGLGVLLAGVALYVDKVYERHQLAVTPVASDTSSGRIRMELLFTNRGNRQVAIVKASPMIGRKGGSARGGHDAPGEGTEFPVVVPPGEVRNVMAVTAFDIRAEWDLIEGRPTSDGGKIAHLVLHTQTLDSRGRLKDETTAFGVITVKPEVVSSATDVQPRTILDERNWLGSLW